MKIKFDANLDFQKESIHSIVDLFEGQETCRTNFTVAPMPEKHLFDSDLGVGNKLELLPEEILSNVKNIQLKNGLKPSAKLDSMDFTIEMETGTGKTYVYLRTMFELNKKYGFTKFVIVVPSVAIKEGVFKSLQMTEEHLKTHYDNVNYDYFIYDSQKLEQVRSFATSDYIQIMVINIDAFRKSFTDPEKESKANVIHRTHDKLSGNKPIEFIQATHPIVIIDEPQSVDHTDKAKVAISSLKPLCTLRYSATHREQYNLMYKLDSVDAYERKLVKQIEVASLQVKDQHNKAYIKLLKVDNSKGTIRAQVEIDIQKSGKIKRDKKWIKSGDDLFSISGGRNIYEGYIISDIYCEKGNEYIDFTSNPDIVYLGQALGEMEQGEFKRVQIRKTIEEHLDKELKLRPKGIKVLSLFFIDKVANYRIYDEDGNPQKGKYAQIFEEEYSQIIKKPKFNTLFEGVDRDSTTELVHNGYFAIDGKKKDTSGREIYKESSGEGKTVADESAYHLIMRDKEKLIGFDTKLKFIFSHSALKEGWDNPNVFQICTLNETGSEMKKRQEIGRGLRIAVNQDGDRVHGFEVNTLTIMANESYEAFAEALQNEIEREEGIKFGVVEDHTFANVVVLDKDEKEHYLGVESSESIWKCLLDNKYICDSGKVQESLKKDLNENTIKLPEEYAQAHPQIIKILKKITGKLNIKNADDKKIISLNKAVYLSDDFKELWDRIKYKTTHRVDFNVDELIAECSKEIKENLIVGRAKIVYQKGKTEITKGGVSISEVRESMVVYGARDYVLPDVVGYLQNETNLTRKTIVDILIKSERLEDFKNNPQKYIDEVGQIIKRTMRRFIVDGIKYQKIGDAFYWSQELFESEELFGYLEKNMIESTKSIYDHTVYDSDIESSFAKEFEKSDDIKLYAKLPGWFKVETPLGNYNPDWAVVIERDGKEKLYFVVESKGSLFTDALRPIEKAKINCGKAHFKALDTDVKFAVANKYENITDLI
ncbi:MAG: DEAD/DEAH box helicase family protein [Candidatus Omnitrophica bacterium]|nr:DEAD/DEAH box helicase family protein [Candidatus Omnitrophota bacterium]